MTIHGIEHLFQDSEPIPQQSKKSEPTCYAKLEKSACEGELYYLLVAYNNDGIDWNTTIVLCKAHVLEKGLPCEDHSRVPLQDRPAS